MPSFALSPLVHGGGRVERLPQMEGWRLWLPPGMRGYRLAQLDDYDALPRRVFPWRPPLILELEARVQPETPPGTWGFGFWNDPFVLLGGAGRCLPTGPQAVWFFGASPPNHLSLHPGVPARGFFAGVTTWHMPMRHLPWLPLAGLAAWLPSLRNWARRHFQTWMRQWGVVVPVSPAGWHRYTLLWRPDQVRFFVDGVEIGHSPWSPKPPLGLVIWVDNQFAAWAPGQPPRWGTLPCEHPVLLEIRRVRIMDAF